MAFLIIGMLLVAWVPYTILGLKKIKRDHEAIMLQIQIDTLRENCPMPLTEQEYRDLAEDLALCDLGLALTKGKLRKRYADRKKALMKIISDENKASGADELTDDEILAEIDQITNQG